MDRSRLILVPIILSSHILWTGKEQKMKTYKVTYKSRYYPFEGDHHITVRASSKKEVRNQANWHSLMGTDEYRIVKVEEVK